MSIETLQATGEPSFKRVCEHLMTQKFDLDAKLEEILERDFGILEHLRLEDSQTARMHDIYIIGRNQQEAGVVCEFQRAGIDDPDPEWRKSFTIVAPPEVLEELKKVSV